MVLGSVENLKQPDALIIDRAGFQFMWPGEKPALGKVIELNDHRAVIAGISDASAPFTTFPVVYTKYSSAMNYIGRTRKQMSFVLVHARPAENTHVLAQRITDETGLKALTWQDFTFATIGYYVKRTGIPVNFGITVALGFIVGAAVVGQTFYIFVLENLRQFGSLKAMGVANRTILRMVLLQAMVVAGIGYAIGIGQRAIIPPKAGRVPARFPVIWTSPNGLSKWRQFVERFFCDRNQFRRIATRYEKTDGSDDPAMIHLAATRFALGHVHTYGLLDTATKTGDDHADPAPTTTVRCAEPRAIVLLWSETGPPGKCQLKWVEHRHRKVLLAECRWNLSVRGNANAREKDRGKRACGKIRHQCGDALGPPCP
jgi:hypothetical protein